MWQEPGTKPETSPRTKHTKFTNSSVHQSRATKAWFWPTKPWSWLNKGWSWLNKPWSWLNKAWFWPSKTWFWQIYRKSLESSWLTDLIFSKTNLLEAYLNYLIQKQPLDLANLNHNLGFLLRHPGFIKFWQQQNAQGQKVIKALWWFILRIQISILQNKLITKSYQDLTLENEIIQLASERLQFDQELLVNVQTAKIVPQIKQDLLKLNPVSFHNNYTLLTNNMAYCYTSFAIWWFERGQLDQAFEAAQLANILDPSWGYPEYLLGWFSTIACFNDQEAINHFAKAAELDWSFLHKLKNDKTYGKFPDIIKQVSKTVLIKC